MEGQSPTKRTFPITSQNFMPTFMCQRRMPRAPLRHKRDVGKVSVATLALGSRPRQGGCKVAGQERRLESHFTCSKECKECEGMNLHTHK
jgi:hypothetical protein